MAESTHYLIVIQPTRPAMLAEGPTPREERIVSEHFAYLQALTESGIVLHAGRTLTTDERSLGIIIVEAASPSDARQVVENDPAVRESVFRAELYPYRIALVADNVIQ